MKLIARNEARAMLGQVREHVDTAIKAVAAPELELDAEHMIPTEIAAIARALRLLADVTDRIIQSL